MRKRSKGECKCSCNFCYGNKLIQSVEWKNVGERDINEKGSKTEHAKKEEEEQSCMANCLIRLLLSHDAQVYQGFVGCDSSLMGQRAVGYRGLT